MKKILSTIAAVVITASLGACASDIDTENLFESKIQTTTQAITTTAATEDEDLNMELTDEQKHLQDLYNDLLNTNEQSLSDNKLTNDEKETLTSSLDTLIQGLKDEYINNMVSAMSVYSDSDFMDTMTDFAVEYYKGLDNSKAIIVSYWDKLYKGENITDSDKEAFDKELDYFKGLTLS